ncbi:MAG: DUF1080 domain-containing protein [Planctomycetota bacterium]|nr:MAG: DUF1080 domain-containing protein [Planctomycetota bacterium]
MTLLLLLSLLLSPQSGQEEDYYRVDYLEPPAGAIVEVGGMDFLPDGRLAVSTRRGQVWLVENPLAEDPKQARFQLFAEGLQEGLGLKVVEGEIYIVQRGELSRLIDLDGDGRCDRIDCLQNGWGLSGNYHEFAFGLPVDADGNFYVSLNVAFFSPKWWAGKAPVPYRGWVLKISPQGEMTPLAFGLRSPCGIGLNAEGDLFVTDNQGDWMPVCPLFHIQEGGFYGHPASLDWTPAYRKSLTLASDTIPSAHPRRPAALWIPYKWSRSTGNMVPDMTGGRFGPFDKQLFLGEVTNGMVLRADLEKVRREYQGAVWPFRQKVGSTCRVRFAEDGTLFCGMTNRGWGGLAPGHGIARVRWTGKTPLEASEVRLQQDGFRIRFTKALDPSSVDPNQFLIEQYDYDYWWEYGSPERHTEKVVLSAISLEENQHVLRLFTAGMKPARVVRVITPGLRAEDGSPLLHPEFAYTLNQFPQGPLTEEHIAKIVPPPPPRDIELEGWMRLTWADAMDAWQCEGWQLCDAEIDLKHPEQFKTMPGNGALINVGKGPSSNYQSRYSFSDMELELDFMLPRGGESGIYLMGCYEIQLRDQSSQGDPAASDCGGVTPSGSWPGRPPAISVYQGPGVWHSLKIRFEAPRFDHDGSKKRNARLSRVILNDTVIHQNVALPGPTDGAPVSSERPFGPIVIEGTSGPVAIRGVMVKPIHSQKDEDGWVDLFNGEDLDGWKTSGKANWSVEDYAIIGQGDMGHLYSPRNDYRNFEFRARVKINDGGNSGMYFRTAYGEGWPKGYEAQVNSSFPDPQKSGSLYGLAPIKVHLIPTDTWFTQYVRCVEEPEGTRISIRINDILVSEYLDKERRHASGHFALQQHHQGSVVEYMDVQVREILGLQPSDLLGRWTSGPAESRQVLVFQEDGKGEWIFQTPQGSSSLEVTWTLDASVLPARLDIGGIHQGPLRGMTLFGIAKLEHGALFLDAEPAPQDSNGDATRPREFSAETLKFQR